MSHTRPRLGRHALVLAIAMLLVVPVGAQATTVSFDGDTLVVTGGDNADHEIQFRLSTGHEPRRHPGQPVDHVDPGGLPGGGATPGSAAPATPT